MNKILYLLSIGTLLISCGQGNTKTKQLEERVTILEKELGIEPETKATHAIQKSKSSKVYFFIGSTME